MNAGFVYNDGGRSKYFKGTGGDCVTRAICIASGMDYLEVYSQLAGSNANQRKGKKEGSKAGKRTALRGINTGRQWFKDFMRSIGFTWVPTMLIGQGCKVHLCAEELPQGRLIVAVSKHYTTMIDGIINDTFDPRRDIHCTRPNDGTLRAGEWLHEDGDVVCSIQRRCVYGYWIKK
jgi:hypothetical protein